LYLNFDSQFLGLSKFGLVGSILNLNWSVYENNCLLKYMIELHFNIFLRFYCIIDYIDCHRVKTQLQLNKYYYISFVIRFFVLTCLRMAFVLAETCSTHLKVTVWIQINLYCVQLNKCGLCGNKQSGIGFHKDWYIQVFSFL